MHAVKTNGSVAQYVQAWMPKVAMLLWMVLLAAISTAKTSVSVDFSSHVLSHVVIWEMFIDMFRQLCEDYDIELCFEAQFN